MSFAIRALTPDDWQMLRGMRLIALQTSPEVYLSTYEIAFLKTENDWKDMLDGRGRCIFGLFDERRHIGISGVFPFLEDISGDTGFLGMSYIDPAYRGKGLSTLFYQSRIAWAVKNTAWKKLVVSHRESNEPSRRAMAAHGFTFTHKKKIVWPDGVQDWDYNYSLDLTALRGAQ
ncbi:MAG: GNAT family N-acetyltransferase [Alphaproteobacteria bacterium]